MVKSETKPLAARAFRARENPNVPLRRLFEYRLRGKLPLGGRLVVNRRPVLIASTLALGSLGMQRAARASVAREASLDELSRASSLIVVATAGEHRCAWVELAAGRRIVTYTRLLVERVIVGSPSAAPWVRTLGGVVGSVGQLVPGEPRLHQGMSALLFLSVAEDGFVLTERGQGVYPLERGPSGDRVLRAWPHAETLVARTDARPSARALLAGASLASATTLVLRARVADAR